LSLRRKRRQGSGEDYMTGSFMLGTLQQKFLGNQIKKNDMGGKCSTYKGEAHIVFCWGDLREGKSLEDPGVHRRIIIKWIFKK
jgi:hypothetical protein